MSDSLALDRDSRRQIREALLENILVEAGAGSGKTQMLAERMAAGVAAGVYGVERMAAVTFTRKAASELRGRFHQELEREYRRVRAALPGTPGHAEQAARLQAALSNLERLFAGTIHSFCARLLRERPVESGVSPGFTELDEVEDLELRRRAWREFIASARAAGDPLMAELLEADLRPGDLDSAFAVLCDNEDVEFPPGDGMCPDPRPAARGLDAFWTELQKHLPSPLSRDTRCRIQQAALTHERQFRVMRTRLDRASVVASLLHTWDRDSKITQLWWADSAQEKKRLAALVETLHGTFRSEVVAPYLAQWRQYVYRLAIELLTRARSTAAAERRRQNALNYADLLNLTARVLRENAPVRRALQQKFRHLFVDEFQDTDPIQAEILFWLAEDVERTATTGRAADDWRRVALRPGALFVVGDPKQSIYRFRRADIDIYSIVRERLSDPAVGRVLPLTLNFRSAPALCKWANEVFATRFPAEPTRHAPRFAPLDPNPKNTTAGELLTLTHTCGKGDVAAQDAATMAAYIRQEVDAGRRHYRDFLILTRKKADRIGPYADALEELNIPVEVSGAGAFADSAEVRTLTGLLRALADPLDAVPLVAVLRGPLFGISDPELFAFRERGGWFSLFQSNETLADRGDAVASALTTLSKYYRWTRLLPAAAALERILEDSGYLALAATTPGGVDAGDLVHAVDRVRQVVESGGSVADAADALEADREAASEVESLPLEPGRTDVVRVMNLHKAKGLEAEVVFLADPLGGVRRRADVHIQRTGLRARGWLELVRRSETSYAQPLLGAHADWAAHEAAELPYLQAEEDRLMYVAATRARQCLVVSRWTERMTYPAWGALNGFLSHARELPRPKRASAPAAEPLDCSTAAQTAARKARDESHERVKRPSWTVTSATGEERHIATMTRAVEAEVDDPSRVMVVDTPSHRADAGQAWGTLVHGLLEHAMRHEHATRDDLRRLALWLTVQEPRLRLVIDEAVDTVLHVAKAGFWLEARAAAHGVEVPFAFAEASRSVMSGVIDLVFMRGEQARIVDYKTDVDVGIRSDKHTAQLQAYERALRAVGIKDVASAIEQVRRPGDSRG